MVTVRVNIVELGSMLVLLLFVFFRFSFMLKVGKSCAKLQPVWRPQWLSGSALVTAVTGRQFSSPR